jgi:Zn-dependent protease with chaperone function
VRAATALLVLLLVSLSQGCAGADSSLGLWIQRQGGICSDRRQSRAEIISQPLTASVQGRHVTVRVLDCDGACAYGWPDGSIFVTRGLVDLMDDAELAAVVAHELGHLLEDGHLGAVTSLRGCAEGMDTESRADLRGRELLMVSGLPPKAMVRALAKVHATPGVPASCRAELAKRIERLQALERH